MFPEQLTSLVEKQPGDIHRADTEPVIEALKALDISLESELAEFFLNYVITFFRGTTSYE